ncbi:sphingolipid delta(4)-desaturase/C4-monooxygenase DES2-like isoform X2 [Gigantopelta aegis]|nr:sphingolipid delta(4)-desaturase/C4-monooxygenase DES2-like isoform X2 [Gigantopelta aegis]
MKTTKETFKWFYRCLSLDVRTMTPDEDWQWTEEPHTARRQAILKKHPEIKKLMGPDSFIVYIVVFEVLLQFILAWLVRDASWTTILALAYCAGAVLNHSLGSAIHEIGHNLAFGHSHPIANRVLSIWCNLPLAAPIAISYRIFHSAHHRYLGEEYADVDIPTRLECYLFRRPVTKMLWLFFHPIIHGIRPFYKSPRPVTGWEIINFAAQVVADILVVKLLGFRSLIYLFSGMYIGLGFHPLAAHFISEHYLFNGGQATHSYYGPLNPILFNVGYHIEHHDFPYISYNKLPQLKKIAPEFYQQPYHTSWIKVLWDFIFDENMGPHARGVGYLKDGVEEKLKSS